MVSLFVSEHVGLTTSITLSSGSTPDVITIAQGTAELQSVVIKDSFMNMLYVKGMEKFNRKSKHCFRR